jgi:hypothetical protein
MIPSEYGDATLFFKHEEFRWTSLGLKRTTHSLRLGVVQRARARPIHERIASDRTARQLLRKAVYEDGILKQKCHLFVRRKQPLAVGMCIAC